MYKLNTTASKKNKNQSSISYFSTGIPSGQKTIENTVSKGEDETENSLMQTALLINPKDGEHVTFSIAPPVSRNEGFNSYYKHSVEEKRSTCPVPPQTSCANTCYNQCAPITVGDLVDAIRSSDNSQVKNFMISILNKHSNLPSDLFCQRWNQFICKPHCGTASTPISVDVTATSTDNVKHDPDITEITGISSSSQTLCLRSIITSIHIPDKWQLHPFGNEAVPTAINCDTCLKVYIYAPFQKERDCNPVNHNHDQIVKAVSYSSLQGEKWNPHTVYTDVISVQQEDTDLKYHQNKNSCTCTDECTCVKTVVVISCLACQKVKEECKCQRYYDLYTCDAKWECHRLNDDECGRRRCTYVLTLCQDTLCKYDECNKEIKSHGFSSFKNRGYESLIFYINNQTIKLA
jgi:hypothetical protein